MSTPARVPPTLVRRNSGRGHSYELDGFYAPGVTHLLAAGFPKPAIPRWAMRTCAEVVLNEWMELGRMKPAERFERVRSAPDRDRDAMARRGSEVHAYAVRLMAGEEVSVPEELVPHVDSYLAFDRDWQPRELLVEASVAKRSPRYCGTLDLVAELADGQTWLLDWKTTRSGVFAENALQLAAYRHADFYVDADFAERPMPAVDQCGVVWLRADGYDLHPVRAGAAEFRLFQMVALVAQFADRELASRMGTSTGDVVGDALPAPALVEEAVTE